MTQIKNRGISKIEFGKCVLFGEKGYLSVKKYSVRYKLEIMPCTKPLQNMCLKIACSKISGDGFALPFLNKNAYNIPLYSTQKCQQNITQNQTNFTLPLGTDNQNITKVSRQST